MKNLSNSVKKTGEENSEYQLNKNLVLEAKKNDYKLTL